MRVPAPIATRARELRTQRRTRSGARWRPWSEIADELERQGHGRFDPTEIARAVLALPADRHPDAPMLEWDAQTIEHSFRAAWADEFPGEPWPGLAEAQRRFRDRHMMTRTTSGLGGGP